MEPEIKLVMCVANSKHTATVLRTSAQVRQSQTSYVRQTLSEIAMEMR